VETGPGPEGPATDDPDPNGSASPLAPLPAVGLVELVRLPAPIDAVALPDGALLVALRAGEVRLLPAEALRSRRNLTSDDAPRLLDLRARTTTDGERGLLSIALHPNGRQLLVSSTDLAGDTLVEAYPLTRPGGAWTIADEPRVIYRVAQPARDHNGGHLLFAPDGTLLLALGDGGGSRDRDGTGQSLASPLGALLRLSVTGDRVRVPADNPFVGRTDAAAEILAYGLRNPWRMTLDAHTGEIWIADVGQNEVEEINRVPYADLAGANFGWPLREGDRRFAGDEPADHVPPVHVYTHGPGCSVTGGVVYRGRELPEITGAYLFSDLCDGTLRLLRAGPDGLLQADALEVSGTQVVGFAADLDGEIVVLDLSGVVLRLVRA
jgi:glucose/arabinose dehydrogenase